MVSCCVCSFVCSWIRKIIANNFVSSRSAVHIPYWHWWFSLLFFVSLVSLCWCPTAVCPSGSLTPRSALPTGFPANTCCCCCCCCSPRSRQDYNFHINLHHPLLCPVRQPTQPKRHPNHSKRHKWKLTLWNEWLNQGIYEISGITIRNCYVQPVSCALSTVEKLPSDLWDCLSCRTSPA